MTERPNARARLIARLTEWSGENGPEPLSEHASDVRALLGVIGDLQDEVRGLLPPAGLPPVLATVDDVARVADAAGLTEDDTPTESDPRMRSWDDGLLDATDRGGTLWLKVRGPGTSWRSVTYYRQPVGIVWSAIQAARGGAS